ncbi:MAG: SMP-30/gluconolactonase/LRE family protein [Rhodospirillales bacterium]|nr:SMP-30/gluconolactonase/LRE family protein [Rhodospirillales bacterium]
MVGNPIDGFQVDPSELQYIGEGLQRPECILAEPDGTLWSADARGGVVRIGADGSQKIITQSSAEAFSGADDEATRFTEGTLPNGLAFGPGGEIYISNFGTDVLEVMDRSGETRLLYDSIDGTPIGKVNFVLRDSKDRLWLTISTRIKNWMQAVSPDIADGYVALVDDNGIRVVTDGLAFDAYGNLWGTLIMADQIFAITPDGDFRIIIDDGDAGATQALEAAFRKGAVTPELMLAAAGQTAPWYASVTFGGSDLKTVYIGSLRGNRIPYFQSPVAGLAMVHWGE